MRAVLIFGAAALSVGVLGQAAVAGNAATSQITHVRDSRTLALPPGFNTARAFAAVDAKKGLPPMVASTSPGAVRDMMNGPSARLLSSRK